MQLWFLSNPELTSSLHSGRQAHNEAIARVSLSSMRFVKRVMTTAARGLTAGARSLLKAIRRKMQKRRAITALRQLHDSMLKDIGVARSEILGIADGKMPYRPPRLVKLRRLPRPRPTAVAPMVQEIDPPRAA